MFRSVQRLGQQRFQKVKFSNFALFRCFLQDAIISDLEEPEIRGKGKRHIRHSALYVMYLPGYFTSVQPFSLQGPGAEKIMMDEIVRNLFSNNHFLFN